MDTFLEIQDVMSTGLLKISLLPPNKAQRFLALAQCKKLTSLKNKRT